MTCGDNAVTEGGLINPNSLQVKKKSHFAILIQKLLNLLQKMFSHSRRNQNNYILKQQSERMEQAPRQ